MLYLNSFTALKLTLYWLYSKCCIFIASKKKTPPCSILLYGRTIDLEIDNLDRVSIPTKIVATFDVEHPIYTAFMASEQGVHSNLYACI